MSDNSSNSLRDASTLLNMGLNIHNSKLGIILDRLKTIDKCLGDIFDIISPDPQKKS